MLIDTAIPVLPALNLDQTIAFYQRLGFQLAGRAPAPEDYALMRRDNMELHFYGAPELDPATCYAACYLRVTDAVEMHREFGSIGLPALGIPRMTEVETKSWGMREFHVVDPSGVLLRIGDFNTGDD